MIEEAQKLFSIFVVVEKESNFLDGFVLSSDVSYPANACIAVYMYHNHTACRLKISRKEKTAREPYKYEEEFVKQEN